MDKKEFLDLCEAIYDIKNFNVGEIRTIPPYDTKLIQKFIDETYNSICENKEIIQNEKARINMINYIINKTRYLPL